MDKFLLVKSEIEYKKERLFDSIFIIFAIVIFAFLFFVSQFWISISVVQMNSMANTLKPNDKLITDRLAVPKRGDVIVFKYDENTDYIKRIIAVEGQTVYNDKEGNVYLEFVKDGKTVTEKLNETYVKDNLPTYKHLSSSFIDEENSLFRVEVKKGELFVMGDNRLVSIDSRDFGCITLDKVTGVVHDFWIENKSLITKIF